MFSSRLFQDLSFLSLSWVPFLSLFHSHASLTWSRDVNSDERLRMTEGERKRRGLNDYGFWLQKEWMSLLSHPRQENAQQYVQCMYNCCCLLNPSLRVNRSETKIDNRMVWNLSRKRVEMEVQLLHMSQQSLLFPNLSHLKAKIYAHWFFSSIELIREWNKSAFRLSIG